MALSFGLPLNLIRDLVLTTRSFATRIKDLQRYKSASKNMDRLYKAATVEELDALSDKLCIICRDDLIHESLHQGPWPSGLDETPKKLPCSHIFHRHCLKSWLERQQTCPTWYALYFLLVTSNDPTVAHLLFQMLRTRDRIALTMEMKTNDLELNLDVRCSQNLPLVHSLNRLILMKMPNKAMLTIQNNRLPTLGQGVRQIKLHSHHQGRQVQPIRSIQFKLIRCLIF